MWYFLNNESAMFYNNVVFILAFLLSRFEDEPVGMNVDLDELKTDNNETSERSYQETDNVQDVDMDNNEAGIVEAEDDSLEAIKDTSETNEAISEAYTSEEIQESGQQYNKDSEPQDVNMVEKNEHEKECDSLSGVTEKHESEECVSASVDQLEDSDHDREQDNSDNDAEAVRDESSSDVEELCKTDQDEVPESSSNVDLSEHTETESNDIINSNREADQFQNTDSLTSDSEIVNKELNETESPDEGPASPADETKDKKDEVSSTSEVGPNETKPVESETEVKTCKF